MMLHFIPFEDATIETTHSGSISKKTISFLTLISTWKECFGINCDAYLMTRAKKLDLNVLNGGVMNPICSV